MRVTINSAVGAPTDLTVYNLTFDKLYIELEASISEGDKADSDLIISVAEWHEFYRKTSNISRMSPIFIGDIDAVSDEQMDKIVDLLDGYSYILYTTHSHRTPRKQGLNCYRLILELNQGYAPDKHRSLWDSIQTHLGDLLDPGAKSPCQGFYLPSHPPNFGQHAEIIRFEGKPWVVSEKSETRAVEDLLPSPLDPPPPLPILQNSLQSWSRLRKDKEKRATAEAALSLLGYVNPIPLGQGKRNPFLISLAGYLAQEWPRTSPEGLAQHFNTEGWALFIYDGKYSLDTLTDMIRRMQEKTRQSQAVEEVERLKQRTEAILQTTEGQRSHIITPEEVAHLEETFGDWQKHLIAIHKRDYYFLRPDGTYNPGPVLRESFFVAARENLAIFGDYVEYSYEDAKGVHRKTLNLFLEEYAYVINHVVFDLCHPRGGWDSKTLTVSLPAARVAVKPREHPEIQSWLDLLDPHLQDYITMATKFDKMLPALVMTGEKSTGKTVLAMGLGQIFGSDPLDGHVAFGNFNADMLTSQPIVFMDEATPDIYKRQGTTLIRRFITCSSRKLDEKYRSRVELKGFLRLIVAANNLDVLNTSEEMSTQDREAFAERILHIDMDKGADYLQRQNNIQSHWLNNKALAEHFLFLKDRKIKHPGRRFAIASNHTRLHESLASRSGVSDDVSYWLLSYLANPERGEHLPVAYNGNWLRINSKALVTGWDYYLRGHKTPTPSQISRAIKSLSKKGRQKIQIENNGQSRSYHAYEIDPLLLRAANETHGLVPEFEELFNME